MKRWAVILAGGVGSRFWPMSAPTRPKQLLPLVTNEPLLAATVRRLQALAPLDRTLILTNASLTNAIARLLPDLPRENIIAEPAPAGTAAALAWAAAEIERRGEPDAVMLCVHADWSIGDESEFRRALSEAAEIAERHRSLVTVGIVPVRPDPGFGYIQPGNAVEGGARRVARFVEKPERAAAERMVRDGYLWNSGIFVWRADDFLAELRDHTPEVAPALASSGASIAKFFATVTSISVDVGVLERSSRVLVLPGEFGWDDVGTWAALSRVRALDASGNASHGAVHTLDAERNVVHANGNTVVLYGVAGLVVVTAPGLTLVTTVERSADLKALINSLPAPVRDRA